MRELLIWQVELMRFHGLSQADCRLFLFSVEIPAKLAKSQDKCRYTDDPREETGPITKITALPKRQRKHNNDDCRKQRGSAEPNRALVRFAFRSSRYGGILCFVPLGSSAFDHRIEDAK